MHRHHLEHRQRVSGERGDVDDIIEGTLDAHALAFYSFSEVSALTLSWSLGITPLATGDTDDGAQLVVLDDATIDDVAVRPLAELEAELDFARCAVELLRRTDATW